MSKESLQQFYQRVLREPSLQEHLRAAPDRASIVRRAIELGEQHGYSFTAEEVEDAMKQAQLQPQALTVGLASTPQHIRYAAS